MFLVEQVQADRYESFRSISALDVCYLTDSDADLCGDGFEGELLLKVVHHALPFFFFFAHGFLSYLSRPFTAKLNRLHLPIMFRNNAGHALPAWRV